MTSAPTASPPAEEALPKLGPWEATLWMGHSTSAWFKTMSAGRWSVSPGNWFGCAFDLAFTPLNSFLGSWEKLLLGSKIARVELPSDPIFILGHWRTGTTWLHELLAADPRHRAPTTFECFCPHHALLSYNWLTSWTGFTLPSKRPPDAMPVGWHLPQEDEFALLNLGVPSIYRGIGFPHQTWPNRESLELDALPAGEKKNWQRNWLWFLRTVLARRSGRLVLKSPQHTFRIPTLKQLFPHARFIYLVRNPRSVIPSTIRLWRTLSSVHGYSGTMRATLEDEVLELFGQLHRRVEVTRPLVEPNCWQTLRYEDFVQNPEESLRELYERLDLGDFAPAAPIVEQMVERRQSYRPNRHQIASELDDQIADRCADYSRQYGYLD